MKGYAEGCQLRLDALKSCLVESKSVLRLLSRSASAIKVKSDFLFHLMQAPRFVMYCACAAQNNRITCHIARLLIHLVWSLQEMAVTRETTYVPLKALNASHLSWVFLKYFIEHLKSEELVESFSVTLSDAEALFAGLPKGFCVNISLEDPLQYCASSNICP